MPKWQPKLVWLGHPGVLAAFSGICAYVVSALAQPPPVLVAMLLSLPFFYYVAESRWKDCAVWIIATVPFQYYFEIGGLTLTHTELYLFVFAAAYCGSRAYAEKAFLLPAVLMIPVLYGLAQMTPAMTGHMGLLKQGIRTLVAVFFCPQRPGNPSPRRSWCVSWGYSR